MFVKVFPKFGCNREYSEEKKSLSENKPVYRPSDWDYLVESLWCVCECWCVASKCVEGPETEGGWKKVHSRKQKQWKFLWISKIFPQSLTAPGGFALVLEQTRSRKESTSPAAASLFGAFAV